MSEALTSPQGDDRPINALEVFMAWGNRAYKTDPKSAEQYICETVGIDPPLDLDTLDITVQI